MANLSFTNTPEGGLAVTSTENEYSEAEDQIGGVEIEGAVNDGVIIQYDGSTSTWQLVDPATTQNVISVEDGGTETVSDLSALNFTSNISVTDAGSGVADIELGTSVLLGSNTQFALQSISGNANTAGNVLNLVDVSGGNVTLTIDTADANDGAVVAVSEFSGGSTGNTVSVATEGSANVNGGSTDSVSEGAAKVYAYDSSRSDWTVVATG